MLELKIEMISVSESIRHQLLSVLARSHHTLAVADDEPGQKTLIEHSIETGHRPPFSQKARTYRVRVDFLSRALDTLHPLGILFFVSPGECRYASPKVATGKKDGRLGMC